MIIVRVPGAIVALADKIKSPAMAGLYFLAEREGFEPSLRY